MHSLLILYPPQPDPEAFIRHYEEAHLALVRKNPGLKAFSYGFNLAAPDGESPYSAVFEANFASREALGAAMGSPEAHAAAADVVNFASVQPIVLTYPRQVG
ncbi:EthD family reductase [Sphingomonas sp. MMS24-J13]|uniref:EthD family reductase n=1 Tax=Sphingomonas sp. MMS24-J13 TaxID=3238686 RepID=UPI00384BB92C